MNLQHISGNVSRRESKLSVSPDRAGADLLSTFAMMMKRWGGLPLCAAAFLIAAVAGCEGWNRKHDYQVADISPPPEDEEPGRPRTSRVANFADMVEDMMASRQEFLNQVNALQRAYLDSGDTIKANWCRRLAWQLNEVLDYPFLTAAPAEHRADVMPEQTIPEADSLYGQALSLYKEVAAIPLAGALEPNKEKARRALSMFKRVLKEHPKSDKVDECAFYCGEIYKEYLREEDPDDELSVRYYQWAVALNPQVPLPARFQCAVVYDFRRHDRARAIELYHQVMELEEASNASNVRFSATRVEQLTDEQYSHLKPEDRPKAKPVVGEPRGGDVGEPAPRVRPTVAQDEPQETRDTP